MPDLSWRSGDIPRAMKYAQIAVWPNWAAICMHEQPSESRMLGSAPDLTSWTQACRCPCLVDERKFENHVKLNFNENLSYLVAQWRGVAFSSPPTASTLAPLSRRNLELDKTIKSSFLPRKYRILRHDVQPIVDCRPVQQIHVLSIWLIDISKTRVYKLANPCDGSVLCCFDDIKSAVVQLNWMRRRFIADEGIDLVLLRTDSSGHSTRRCLIHRRLQDPGFTIFCLFCCHGESPAWKLLENFRSGFRATFISAIVKIFDVA